MFYTKIINPTTAEIQWQYNCHRNTELICSTIRVRSAERLVPAINSNKVAWMIRTLEEFCTGVSKSLILEAKFKTSPYWKYFDTKARSKLTVSDESNEWREKWRKRVELRRLTTSLMSEYSFQNMLLEIQKRLPDIFDLVPDQKSLRHTALHNVANEIAEWVNLELTKLKAQESTWMQ